MFSKVLVVVLTSLTLGLVPVEAHAAQCLSQFPDSAWAHGAPIGEHQLGNDLVLYNATVTTAQGQDFKGVVVPWAGNGMDGIFLQTGQTLLSTNLTIDNGRSEQDIDKYLTLSAYNVIPEKSISQVPITVSWEYRGATCGTRNVTVHSYLDVKPALTINIQDQGITNADLEPLFKSLGNLNFLQKQEIFENLLKTGIAYAATKANPLPLVGATPDEVNKYFYNQPLTFWTSSDGCLIDKITGGRLAINMSNSKVAVGQSSCKITAHYFSRVNPTVQVVANLWVKAAPVSSPTKGNDKITITCIKGKLSKKVSGVNPVCPSGYKKK